MQIVLRKPQGGIKFPINNYSHSFLQKLMAVTAGFEPATSRFGGEQFLAECVYENADDRIAMQPLYDKYAGWFPSTGLRGQLGRSQFGKRVEAAGVPKRRMSEGYCFIGISLR